MAFFLPLAANVVPIANALTHSIRELMERQRPAVSFFEMQAGKLEDYVNIPEIAVGGIIVYSCFCCGLIIPTLFLYGEMSLFLLLLNQILLTLILAVSLLVIQVHKPICELVTKIIMKTLCRRDKKLLPVILKQLDSHESSNNKTALIFIITVAFLLYSSSNFAAVYTLTLKYTTSMVGSEEAVIALPLGFVSLGSGSLKIQNLDREGLSSFVAAEKEKGSILESTLISATMDSETLFGSYYPELTMRLGEISKVDVNIYGLQESYTDSVAKEYIISNEILPGFESQEFVEALFHFQRAENGKVFAVDPYNTISRSEDSHIFAEKYSRGVFQVGVSQNLRAQLGLAVGDYTTLCIRKFFEQE